MKHSNKTESYLVKYWQTLPNGYLEKCEITIKVENKNSHSQVHKILIDKFNINKESIISISYQ